MRGRALLWTPLIACALGAGCGDEFNDDYNWLSRKNLRLIAAKAEPAEAVSGDKVVMDILSFGPDSSPITISWAVCTAPPDVGTGMLSSACITDDQSPYLIPFGTGESAALTLPQLDGGKLGPADITGGHFLPVRIKLASATETLVAIERLRISAAAGPMLNHNPRVESITATTAAGTPTPLDASTPLMVGASDKLALRAHFAAGSDEPYTVDVGDGTTRAATEQLQVAWFSTAGHFGTGSTGADTDTTLDLSRNPPLPGGTIDVWAVGRDDRGGLDYLHRVLQAR